MKTRILIIAVLVGLTSVVMAQPKVNGADKSVRGPKHEMRMNDERGPANGLNLTDAQKEAFKQNHLALQKSLQPLRNELGEAEARQKTLTTVDKPDMGAVNKNIEKIGALRVEMAKLQTKFHLEMRAQLTDEQRLKFDTFKHQMKGDKGQKGMKGMRHQMN